MTRTAAVSTASTYLRMAFSTESPSEIYELRQRSLKPDEPYLRFALGAFIHSTRALGEGSSRDWFYPSPKRLQFVKLRRGFDDPDTHTVFHYVDVLRQSRSTLRGITVQALARWHDDIHAQLQSRQDQLLPLHQDIRPSNIIFHRAMAAVPSELKPQERRYKDLNAKHYAGTITRDEKLELARAEEALDEADASDPELLNLKTKVNEGYDKLQAGLTHINRILDELLKD